MAFMSFFLMNGGYSFAAKVTQNERVDCWQDYHFLSPREGLHYSLRRAITGSTLAERRAGTIDAIAAANNKLNAANTSESDSPVFIAANEWISTRCATKVSTRPASMPAPINMTDSRSINETTCQRCAPSAMRIPISAVRCDAVKLNKP